jgi:hypothetical protein
VLTPPKSLRPAIPESMLECDLLFVPGAIGTDRSRVAKACHVDRCVNRGELESRESPVNGVSSRSSSGGMIGGDSKPFSWRNALPHL